MALVRRTVTPRVIEANRRNARRSTGPRSPGAKANVRLNALRHGRRSTLLDDYFFLWFNAQLACPLDPPPRWNPAEMPIPMLTHPGDDPWRQQQMREFLASVVHYVRPGARPEDLGAAGASVSPEAQRGKMMKKKNHFLTINTTK